MVFLCSGQYTPHCSYQCTTHCSYQCTTHCSYQCTHHSSYQHTPHCSYQCTTHCSYQCTHHSHRIIFLFSLISLLFISTCSQVYRLVSSKDVTKVKINHWSVDIVPADSITMRSVVFLAALPNIPYRMPMQCSSLYYSLLCCCCEVQASTCTSNPSICALCK